MPVLVPDQPLQSRKPSILVENRLKPGRYQFRLEVVDNSGNVSKATVLVVDVRAVDTPPVRPPVDPGILDGGILVRPDRILRPDGLIRPVVDPASVPAPAPVPGPVPNPARPVIERPDGITRPIIRPIRPIR